MTVKQKIFYASGLDMEQTFAAHMYDQWEWIAIYPEGEMKLMDEERPDLLIVDTYSLGLNFLDRILSEWKLRECPVLVIDSYHEEIFIRMIISRGVSGYLHVDDVSEKLDESIRQIVCR